jgi:hypothetical protein
VRWLTGGRAQGALLLLVLAVGGGNLWASWDESHAVGTQLSIFKEQLRAQQAAQRRAGALIEQKLCTDLGTMAQIPPPAGPAAANPSRAYDRATNRAWRGLFTDLRCGRLP